MYFIILLQCILSKESRSKQFGNQIRANRGANEGGLWSPSAGRASKIKHIQRI